MFLFLDGGHKLYPLTRTLPPPVHLPFTLFPNSYLRFPRRSVFQELGVGSAWYWGVLPLGLGKARGEENVAYSFSSPLSYPGRA